MSQSSFNILNITRSLFRQAINNALQALGTGNSGPSAPVETYPFMIWNDTSTNQIKRRNALNNAWIYIGELGQVSDGLVSEAGFAAKPSGFKNKLINGKFRLNQRQVTGTVTLAAGAYGHDRWKAGASGCTYTFSTTENVTTITITAGTLQQIIEGGNLESGMHLLSWQGTAQGKIGAGAFSASGVAGSVTGGLNLTVEFNTGTLTKTQLETGTSATLYEARNKDIELIMCQSYFANVINTIAFNGDITNSVAYYATYSLPVTMRALPVLSGVNLVSSGFPASVGVLTPQFDNKTIAESRVSTLTGTGIFGSTITASAEL